LTDSLSITALQLAERFIGFKEVPGSVHNPAIMAMLQLDQSWPAGDEVPWCSAFANYIAWLLNLPRSRSLRARSWMSVGAPIGLTEARPGFDIVVFSRGTGLQPGPEVQDAPGHVAFYSDRSPGRVRVVGGNQDDAVTQADYSPGKVLGVRRLWG
jgi:uncharacterized protein (TIGR02594 family)